jgi:hypothetical protein
MAAAVIDQDARIAGQKFGRGPPERSVHRQRMDQSDLGRGVRIAQHGIGELGSVARLSEHVYFDPIFG